MGSPITGHQLICFFQDSAFWGHGQSFQGLELVVNGMSVGPAQMHSGWDPSDIQPTDHVEILGGVWRSMGWGVGTAELAGVFECWRRGQRPVPPIHPVAPGPAVSACVVAQSHPGEAGPTLSVPTPPPIKRPVFMARI